MRNLLTMEDSGGQPSTPLATVEDIQRRLLRPSSLPSQSLFPFPSISSPRKLGNSSSSTSLSKMDLNTNKTLEDYLSPLLLSKARAKVGGMKRKVNHGRSEVNYKVWENYDEFEWPIEQLNKLKDASSKKQRIEVKEEEAICVNLGSNTDLIGEDGVGCEGEVGCTPFGRFEVMAMKKFKGGCSNF